MEGMENNQNEIGNEVKWDNTYGKKKLPQVNNTYGVQNTLNKEKEQARQNAAEQISAFGPPVQPYLPPDRNRKNGVLIALGIVLAVILICVGAGYFTHITSPAYRIRKGFENMDREWEQMRNPLARKLDADGIAKRMAEIGSHINTRLDFTVDTYTFGDVTLGIDTDFYRDAVNKEMDAQTNFSIMNFEFAHFNLYGDEDVLCFSIPELFLEDIYIETGDVSKQYNNSMWADSYMFGEMDEEYVIDLFPDTPQYESVHSWQDIREYLGKCSENLEPCLAGARIEKAGKGMYRVSFDGTQVNYVLRDLLQTYEDMTGQDMYDMLSCLQLVSMGEDIEFLIKMDGKGRIRSIELENPVSILDHQMDVEGEILFNGEERSIDLLQGELVFTSHEDDEELEFIWQVDQWIGSDEYQVEADMKCSLMDEEVNLKYTGAYDARNDEFEAKLSMKDDWSVCNILGNGRFHDIRPGWGYEMELEEFSMTMDGEELFSLSGDIEVETFQGGIERSAKAKNAFFEMTMEDWYRVMERIDEEYDSLWNMLP